MIQKGDKLESQSLFGHLLPSTAETPCIFDPILMFF